MNIEMGNNASGGMLLKAKAQYRVTHPKIAFDFFVKFMEAGKSDRGYRVRFIEIPERCAVELQAHSEYDLLILERALRGAKIIRTQIPFEVNPVLKMMGGRRDSALAPI